MAAPYKYYLAHMFDATGYRATWDPGKPLQIGHVGKLDKSGVFIVYSSLISEGIKPEILTDTSDSDLDYTSKSGITINSKLAGEVPVAGSALTAVDAGFDIEMKNEKSIVFKVGGYKTHQITNLLEIERQITDKYRDGNWDKDLLVVTELIEAESATIIIANSTNANLSLKAKGGLAVQELKISDASLNLTIARESGSTLKFLSQNHLTPLYKVMGIYDPFFGEIDFRNKGFMDQEVVPEFTIRDFNERELKD